MTTTMTTAVLVLRSSCLSTGEGNVSKTHNATSIESEVNKMPQFSTTDDPNSDDHDTESLLMRRRDVFSSTLFSCDLAILPEIPVDGSRNNGGILMQRQSFNPCGIDNVLVLSDLPPSGSESYLLSITSCKASFTLEETNDDAIVSQNVQGRQQVVPVNAVPSTFTFQTGWNESNDDEDHSVGRGYSAEDYHSPLEMSHDYSELSITFDMGPVESLVGRLLQEKAEKQKEFKSKQPTDDRSPFVSSSSDPTTRNAKQPFQHDSSFFSGDGKCSASGQSSRHDELLMLLQDIAEKETRDINRMLGGMGILLVVLVLFYIHLWSTKKSRGRRARAESIQAATMETPAKPVSVAGEDSAGSQVVSREEQEGEEGSEERPPVKTVSVNHEDSDAMTPLSFVGPPSPPKATRRAAIVNPASLSMTKNLSHMFGEYAEHHDPNGIVRYLPLGHGLVEGDNGGQPDENVVPNRLEFAEKDEYQQQPSTEGKLSPCSKLEQEWLRNKDSRQASRGGTKSKSTITPKKDAPSVSFHSMLGVSRAKLTPLKGHAMSKKAVLQPIRSVKSSITSESTPRARDPKLSPYATPATRRSAESEVEHSFLNDYWGA